VLGGRILRGRALWLDTSKLFGNGRLDSVEGQPSVGGLLVEFLKSDDGLDVGVDAVQVAAVTGGEDPPVLRVANSPFDRDPDLRERGVEFSLVVGEVDLRLLLDGDVHGVGFARVSEISQGVTDRAA
jgi:hypothetical protein